MAEILGKEISEVDNKGEEFWGRYFHIKESLDNQRIFTEEKFKNRIKVIVKKNNAERTKKREKYRIIE